MKHRVLAVAAAAVVLAGSLTACHPGGPATRPATRPAVGATIGPEQVGAAAAQGRAAFPVGPGSFVVVDPQQPLPAAVVGAVKAELGDLRTPASSASSATAITARISGVLDHLNQTGMYGVLIVPGFTYDAAWKATPVVQVVTFAPGFDPTGPVAASFPDAARARAAVQAVIAKRPGATRYAVVDATT